MVSLSCICLAYKAINVFTSLSIVKKKRAKIQIPTVLISELTSKQISKHKHASFHRCNNANARANLWYAPVSREFLSRLSQLCEERVLPRQG